MGLDLNVYSGICVQIIVLTVQPGAMFIIVCIGTLYFYKKDVGGFVHAYAEGYLSCWTQETPQLMSDVNPPSLLVVLTA